MYKNQYFLLCVSNLLDGTMKEKTLFAIATKKDKTFRKKCAKNLRKTLLKDKSILEQMERCALFLSREDSHYKDVNFL